jgi:hypothetical protein
MACINRCVSVSSRENEVEEPKEEGPKEMTLDEWKAMQDKERAKVEFNIRKPNEGADSKWNKGYMLHKSKSEDVSDEKPKDVSDTNCAKCLLIYRCAVMYILCFAIVFSCIFNIS